MSGNERRRFLLSVAGLPPSFAVIAATVEFCANCSAGERPLDVKTIFLIISEAAHLRRVDLANANGFAFFTRTVICERFALALLSRRSRVALVAHSSRPTAEALCYSGNFYIGLKTRYSAVSLTVVRRAHT